MTKMPPSRKGRVQTHRRPCAAVAIPDARPLVAFLLLLVIVVVGFITIVVLVPVVLPTPNVPVGVSIVATHSLGSLTQVSLESRFWKDM